jgi:hypothetical protein
MIFGIAWKVWKYRKQQKEKDKEKQAGASRVLTERQIVEISE